MRSTGRIVAVASGKGGTGKTWFSITLAHALARAGRRVLLFDGDLGLANVDIQLGLTVSRDLGTVITGKGTLADVTTRYAPGGFDVVAGRSGSGSFATLRIDMVARLLTALQDRAHAYDDVLLDLGAGLDMAVRHLAASADMLLVIATEEPTSITDAYAVLKLHACDNGTAPARIVVNQASSRSAGERTYATLARACGTFLQRTPPLAGIIRRDDRVRDAIRRQTLLGIRHPASAALADVDGIARRLDAAMRDRTAGPAPRAGEGRRLVPMPST